MEKTLKLRKPSIKNLLDLLVVAEEMLFSFPVPTDLRMKYEKMRSETFLKLRLRNNGVPLTVQAFEDKPGRDPSNKVFFLETFNCLQQAFHTIENFQEEISFKTVTMKNFYNKLNAFGVKLQLKPEKTMTPEEPERFNEQDFEPLLEKYKQKIHEKNRILNNLKAVNEKIEQKVLSSIELLKEKVSDESVLIEFKELQQVYKELQEKYKCVYRDLEKLKNDRAVETESYENQMNLLKKEIKSSKAKSEEPTEKLETNLLELLNLKQKIADLELSVSKLQSANTSYQEHNSQLSSENSLFKSKCEEQRQKLLQLKSNQAELEKILEYERNTFELKQKTMQQELFSQKSDLKSIQTENLQHIESTHKHDLSKIQEKHEASILKSKEEILHYRTQLATSEENNKKTIKSLQLEVLKAKETIVKQYEELSYYKENKESQEIIEKLENRLIEVQSILKYVAETILPVYEIYREQQQDWNESEVLKNFRNFEEYEKILVSTEFLVFFLEKNLKDKTWLLNKLEQMHLDAKLTKTNSVGTLASPGSFRDRGLYKQIWQDVKDTSLVLQNFEKCRENLISQFVSK